MTFYNRYESAYLGFGINAEPGQGQIAVLGVRECKTRHLGRGGANWGFVDDVAVKGIRYVLRDCAVVGVAGVGRDREVFGSEGRCWRNASGEDVLTEE